jgi:hypothetical protein
MFHWFFLSWDWFTHLELHLFTEAEQTASKKPGDASHEHLGIRSMVRFADSGVGKVKPAPLGGKCDILPKKIMGADAALRIKLKSAAEIGAADIG